MKKLFPEKKNSKRGVLEFFDKKGFYIVLILCLAVVGVTAFFVSSYYTGSSDENYDAQKIIPEEINDLGLLPDEKAANQPAVDAASGLANAKEVITQPAHTPVPPVKEDGTRKPQMPSDTTKPVTDKRNDTGKPVTVSKATTPVKDQKFSMPVFGHIVFEYAQNKLLYSKTLEEWRTHSGIDLAADRGTAVKAAAEGVVSEVKTDPRFGITVILDHKNGTKTVYSNLASDNMVTPNQKIKQGEVIGSVGNTASFEAADQPHLHFEVWKNDEPVDPTKYLNLK